MTAIAFPYLRPAADSVIASDWIISDDQGPVEIDGGCVAHFDNSTTLQATRRVQVNFDAFALSIGVDPDELRIDCVVSLGTGGARLDRRRSVFERRTVTRQAGEASLEISIAGYWLSQSLNLTTELMLVSAGAQPARLAPRVPGARLWKDELRLGLETSSPRFPMEVVSFGRMFPDAPAGAHWFLDWSPGDLDQEFASAVRLYINEDAREFVERVHDADELTLRLLMSSVTAQMTRSVLLAADAELLATGHSGSSVGGVVAEWIERSFPGQKMAAVKTLAEFDPARFEMTLASLLSNGVDNA